MRTYSPARPACVRSRTSWTSHSRLSAYPILPSMKAMELPLAPSTAKVPTTFVAQSGARECEVLEFASNPPIIGLPVAPEVRVRIDKVVHSSVANANAVTTSGGFARCADYAIVGARVLTLLTNHRYEAVAGGKVLDCGDRVAAILSEPRRTRRAAKSLAELSRYHCWIISNHASKDLPARTEIVDFTLRHDHLYAKTMGVSFSRQSRPDFLWDWLDAIDPLPAALGEHPAIKRRSPLQMWVDPECTNLLRKYERDRPSHFSAMTSAALTALADDVEAELKRMRVAGAVPLAARATGCNLNQPIAAF